MKKMDNLLDTPVQYVKGVGPQKAALFKRLKINTVSDLLDFLPRRYEDRSNFVPISKVRSDDSVTIMGKVVAKGITSSKSGKEIFQIGVMDSSGTILATWFNQPYLDSVFEKDKQVILSGKVVWFNRLQMVSPEYELLSGEEDDLMHTGRIVPIYSLTENLHQKFVRRILYKILGLADGHVKEIIPSHLLLELKLPGINEAIKHIHFPDSLEEKNRALRRFKFEEFLLLELAVQLKKKQIERIPRQKTYALLSEKTSDFIQKLSFSLTQAQANALNDIVQDLTGPHPMNRLLQGDVGSGKTVVALAGAYGVIESGYQVVFMAPTEILARQHYDTIQSLLGPFGIDCCLLIGDMKQAKKKKALEDIKTGKIRLVIGTHALIQEKVEYHNMGLVIIDEQHRFGVVQRSSLLKKAFTPDILVMTATPIPRTLALTVYGDLDVSVIDELPPGRGAVVTTHITDDRLKNVYRFIKQEITKGNQAFIIYPVIEESDTIDVKAASTMYEELKNNIFKSCRVGLIHGRMTAEKKNRTLLEFRAGTIEILVSTTIIEVGIDIPNATIMLIENAERFGLSQLHQLRGRIGRGHKKSYCILEGEPKTEEGKARIAAMVDTDNGFVIAEKDIAVRGPGEFLGTRQYGLPELKIANFVTDMPILLQARDAAQKIVLENPSLSGQEYQHLKEALIEKFKGKFKFFNV